MSVNPIGKHEIFDKLDYTVPGLENTKQSVEKYFYSKSFFKHPMEDWENGINDSYNDYVVAEWPSTMHRHYWADPMLRMYLSTSDEKYARGWLDLTIDWIEKNNTEVDHERHLGDWGGSWNVLQVGIRARKWCRLFPFFIKSQSAIDQFKESPKWVELAVKLIGL